MKRVEITNFFVGICSMQVCAVEDALDEEILSICNLENPSGTTGGWQEVIHDRKNKKASPKKCKEHPGRIHYLISC